GGGPRQGADPAGGDLGQAERFGGLGGGAHREGEEGRRAVEGDQFTGGDGAPQGEARAEPHDADGDEAGQEDPGRLQPRLHAAGGLAGPPDLLAGATEAFGEADLAADAAQDPQTGDDVTGLGGGDAHLLALRLVAFLEGPQQRSDAQDGGRDADEHGQSEDGRGGGERHG